MTQEEKRMGEDERMWKLIKKYAHYNISDMALNADHITREQLESWLEKQGKKPQGKSALETRTDNELVEEVYSHLDSIKETIDRMTSGNFMHNKAAIKFSANTIAKVLELIGLKSQNLKGNNYDNN